MAIIFSVVCRGTSILAKYASCTGNFAEVTEQILSKISPNDEKLTYTQGNYLFHYIRDNDLIFFCITDDVFPRARAFLYLEEIKRRFKLMYGEAAASAVPYAMNGEFSKVLATEMLHYSDSKDLDVISRVHGELDELKSIMVKNIDNVAMRGERLELLVNKTENLSTNAVSFRTTSRHLQRTLFWKNIKLYCIMAAVLILVIYLIVSMACGGLAWKSCVR